MWFASTSHQRICVKCKSYGIAPNTHTDISSHQFPCIACEGFDSIGSAAALELSLGGCASAFTENCTHVREIKLQIHWLKVVRDCNSHIRIDDIRFSRTAHPPPHTIQSNDFGNLEWRHHVTQLIRIWNNDRTEFCVVADVAIAPPTTQRYRKVIIISHGYVSTCPVMKHN